ncbi:MAG: trimethylamine methyltransferase family protein [Pseudomonadota bacterium]
MARRRARTRAENGVAASASSRRVTPLGGRFTPCSEMDLARIERAAYTILETIGMSNLPEHFVARARRHGAVLRGDGRICFPPALVDAARARAPCRVSLPGFSGGSSLEIGGAGVHIGTGGAAVQVLDAHSMEYRDSSLGDLFDIMRLLDAAPHIAYGVRPLVARDMPDGLSLDLNTAFACLKATSKPIGVSFSSPDHVAPVVELFDMALGGGVCFRERPFAMAVIVHAVPPLAFASEGVETLAAALSAGMVPQICSAGQVGATSPVTLAGALAQGLAECLAGLVLVDMIAPGAPCIYALMPFVSDLRTGAMAGGSGEGAIASAAAAQLLAGLGLPSTVSAGMTDAKIADAQAGYEKGYTVALAAQAGADMINLSVGMLGSIMVASPEALLIDDDMCGAILRSVEGIDAADALIDLEAIERVVTGEGHYLAEAETFRRMRSDFVYPALGDRRSVDDWLAAGGHSIWERACTRASDILSSEMSDHLALENERAIRARFPIHLPE